MPAADNGNHPRITEWILGGYFSYTLLLSFVIPLTIGTRAQSASASLAVLAILFYLARFPAQYVPTWLRNLLPVAAVLLAYQQMGWYARPAGNHELEHSWVRWDKLLLVDWGLKDAIESLGPVLPSLLELAYLCTYAVGPAGLLALLACGRMHRTDRYLAFYVASAVASYAFYPFFPSEPPRTVFPGELLGEHDNLFRDLNWWILGLGGIHTSVFPSGHVSSACGAAFGLLFSLPERKRYGIAACLLAFGIAVGTVYGRYHYAVDALAGLVVSSVVSLACACTFRWSDALPNGSKDAADQV